MLLRWIVIAILLSAIGAALPTLLRDKKMDRSTPERILNDLKARLTKSTVDGREASGVGVADDPDDLKASAEAEAAGREKLRQLQEQEERNQGLSPADAEELRRLQGKSTEEPKQRVLAREPAGAAEATKEQSEADSLLEKLKGKNSAEGIEQLGR